MPGYGSQGARGRAYTPEEARAAIAAMVANPVPAQAAKYQYSYNMMGSWRIDTIPGVPGYHVEDVRIDDQKEKPENPGRIGPGAANTWGRTIPLSIGKRRIVGNLLQSSALVPRLEGTREIVVEYEIPVYEDPPPGLGSSDEPGQGGFQVVDCAGAFCAHDRPDPNNPPGNGCGTNGSPCDDFFEPRATTYRRFFGCDCDTNPDPLNSSHNQSYDALVAITIADGITEKVCIYRDDGLNVDDTKGMVLIRVMGTEFC